MMQRAWSGGPVGLACLLAACGGGDDGGGATIDAVASTDAEVDAVPIDAVPIDAGPPMVSVQVGYPMGPFPGAIVIVLDADDQVATSTTTDASGAATALLPAGGKVIVAQSPTAGVGYLWVAPEPGDVLRVNVAPGALPATQTATVVVPAVNGTTTYRVESPCGSGTSATNTITYTYRPLPGCTSHDLRAARLVTGVLSGAFYVTDQSVSAGGTVDLQSRTWAAPVNLTVNANGLPAGATTVTLTGQLVEDGHGVGGSFGGAVTPSGGAASSSAPVDDLAAARLLVRTSFQVNGATITLGKVGAQAAGTLDAAAARTHDVTTLAYDDGADVLSWSESTSGLAPQGAYIRLDYGAPLALFGGNNLTWNVIAPAGGTFEMPSIPAELPAFAVTNRNNVLRSVTLFHHSRGAAFVRQTAFSVRAEVDLLPDGATLAQSLRSSTGL